MCPACIANGIRMAAMIVTVATPTGGMTVLLARKLGVKKLLIHSKPKLKSRENPNGK